MTIIFALAATLVIACLGSILVMSLAATDMRYR